MDRMRAGLTGLGVVFLFTLAASLAFGPSEDEPSLEASTKAPGEPLSQLGVAPSNENADRDEPADVPPPQPAPAPPAPPPAAESPVMGAPDPSLSHGADRPVAI
jgi:hypothetical protein